MKTLLGKIKINYEWTKKDDVNISIDEDLLDCLHEFAEEQIIQGLLRGKTSDSFTEKMISEKNGFKNNVEYLCNWSMTRETGSES